MIIPVLSWADSSDDMNALYGELGILQEQVSPELRTGHDALQPLTNSLAGYFGFKDGLRENAGLLHH